MPAVVHTRVAPMALLAGAALAGAALAGGFTTGAAARGTSAPPCASTVTAIGGRRAIAYCGPATAEIQIAGRTYRFRDGLCDRSATIGALALSVGTLVQGAAGNAGRSFVGLVIAKPPSESEALEADAGGQQLFGDSVIAEGGTLLSQGTFTSVLGPAFSGSWNCHGVIYTGP
jgi:hypothetical protein